MDREENGRFSTGNPGGPGRPPRATEAVYLNILMEECDIETWRGVVAKAAEDAKEGDSKARDWLGKYLMGAPKEAAPSLLAVNLELLSDIDPVTFAHAKRIDDENMDEIFSPELKRIRGLARELMEEETV